MSLKSKKKWEEKEKEQITDFLQDLSDEERNIETIFKKHKLERWGAGLQKGLTQYVQETYDQERAALEKQALMDVKLGKNMFVTDMNRDIYIGHLLEMDKIFTSFSQVLNNFDNEHGYANSRARLRMATLYQVAAANNGIVVGTGNKVEDFGVGFYTKYGDGGVDISPIADCNKSEVWELGKELGILKEIIDAPPTDGLWDDGRTDEGQLGFKYQDLEDAMVNPDSPHKAEYEKIRKQNLHKMEPIPVCKIPS